VWYNSPPNGEQQARHRVTYTLALGPFHPILHGPQRFLLRIGDERIADIEYQNDLNERGCAARMARLDLEGALQLACRICGECSFAHALAFCSAIEQLCVIDAPRRAQQLRVAAAELERAASHLRGAAQTLDALGMAPNAERLLAVRESVLQLYEKWSGAPIAPDLCRPGGMSRDLASADREELLVALPGIGRNLYRAIDRLIDNRALLLRTLDIGGLPKAAAEQLGVRGPLARAAGIARDARSDHRYGLYGELEFATITQEGGDVYARLVVLLLEAYESIKLIEQALRDLADTPCLGSFPRELRSGAASAAVEGPRGMIRYTIESDGERLKSVRIDTPRQFDRLLVRTFLSGALVDNAAPIIASAYACVACAEC
jgi:Ni,Fe-hydrogenase III large subunit